MDLENLCLELRPIVEAVALFIEGEMGKIKADQIDEKGLNSLVSYVDQEAERRLVKAVAELVPAAGFLTEEETIQQSKNELQWIIDPLDGTTNFLHQLPFYSISVALEYRKEIILGVVFECNRKECFYAWKNGGAYLNDHQIQVSKNEQLKDTLLATGFPYFEFDNLNEYLETLSFFIQNTRGLRRLGSAALDLAYVACGRFDGFFETNLNPWDVAAGVILIKEAGGIITDFNNEDKAQEGKQMLGSNGRIHQQMLEQIKYN